MADHSRTQIIKSGDYSEQNNDAKDFHPSFTDYNFTVTSGSISSLSEDFLDSSFHTGECCLARGDAGLLVFL